MSTKKVQDTQEIPEFIHDSVRNKKYQRLKLLGQGGYGKCYELKDLASRSVHAGKIVSIKRMVQFNCEKAVLEEISILRSLQHMHVVGFHSFIKDSQNFYIIMELCKQGSMRELLKRRKIVTEPETRYYMHQILLGVQYLHSKHIIHRDLKPANIFLDEALRVKIGDFGLSTRVLKEGEKKMALCGTPSYTAPEVLTMTGYSYEVDIWSLGCIMYALLVGQPPFKAAFKDAVYEKIRLSLYRVPSSLPKHAISMIVLQLQQNPAQRPSIDKLLVHEFFTAGIMPSALPLSCLTTAPQIDQLTPLCEVCTKDPTPVECEPLSAELHSYVSRVQRGHLLALRDQLNSLLTKKLTYRTECIIDKLHDSDAQPFVWVTLFKDYVDENGFGYQLCDASIGVMFYDSTKLVMHADKLNIEYIKREGLKMCMTEYEYPSELEKKMKLLTQFRRYAMEHPVKTGASVPFRDSEGSSQSPHMHQWFKNRSAVTMFLSNGTLQINFKDQTKIILCSVKRAITYVDAENFRTFRFSTIEEHGCNKKLYRNLFYALGKINRLFNNRLV